MPVVPFGGLGCLPVEFAHSVRFEDGAPTEIVSGPVAHSPACRHGPKDTSGLRVEARRGNWCWSPQPIAQVTNVWIRYPFP
jgi:hypothetical protein